jgi:hypothetical protein
MDLRPRQRKHLPCGGSLIGTPRNRSTFSTCPSGPTHHDTPSPKQDSDSNPSPKSPNIAIPMQAPLHLLVLIVRCIPAFFRSHREQVIVELALRQQLATYDRKITKTGLTPFDRAFWVTLFRLWPGRRQALVIVKPDTVIRWHRKGFRLTGGGFPGQARGGLAASLGTARLALWSEEERQLVSFASARRRGRAGPRAQARA